MEAKQLIESGSLELYVMQSLPPKEMKEIDDMRKQNKEVNLEIYRIENALEEFAFAQAREPKPELKEEIEKRIGFGLELDLDMENVKSVIIHLQPLLKFAVAASFVLALSLGLTTFYFYRQYNNTSTQLAELKSKEAVLANEVNTIRASYTGLEKQLAVVSNPAVKHVPLKGLPIAEKSSALVFWNKETGNTYINTAGLPAVSGNEQFQLWAIVDGKPVDMGVLDKNSSFMEMKNVTNATAFAITLEPLGGKPTPTLEKMYVMGAV